MKPATTATGRRRVKVLRALVIAGIAVAIASTIWLAIWRTTGDFSATLPGGYAERLNPDLWNSPDLRESWAFHQNTYLHGPVQYLTLYPIVFLDSYAAIAWVLLPIYMVVCWFAFYHLLAALGLLVDRRTLTFALAATAGVFIPLLQAFVHREFEVVILLALCWALHALLMDRRGVAGGLLAYVAWFKYIPLVFLPYLVLRGWTRAIIAFVVTSVVIVALAHALFGFEHFFDNNVPRHASTAVNFSAAEFCARWSTTDETLSSVRQGLCRVQYQSGLMLARNTYVALCAGIALVYLTAYVRLFRQRLDRSDERWRRALEISIATTVYTSFVFGHYYYLSALLVPFGVLLARNLSLPAPRRWMLWGAAYFLISASAMPLALASWAVGADTWHFYMRAPMYLYGELLLMALLLADYWALGSSTHSDRLQHVNA